MADAGAHSGPLDRSPPGDARPERNRDPSEAPGATLLVPPVSRLPDEALCHMASFLALPDAARLARCSARLGGLTVGSPAFWRDVYRRNTGSDPDDVIHAWLAERHPLKGAAFWRWLVRARSVNAGGPAKVAVGFSTDKDGVYFAGDRLGGLGDGWGYLTQADGTEAAGRFEFGYSCGPGILRDARGKVHIGSWRFGKLHGHVKRLRSREDGKPKASAKRRHSALQPAHFKGHYVNDERKGMGLKRYESGVAYYGRWSEGRWSGPGVLVNAAAAPPCDRPDGTRVLARQALWSGTQLCAYQVVCTTEGDVLLRATDDASAGTSDGSPIALLRGGLLYLGTEPDPDDEDRTALLALRYPNGDVVGGTWSLDHESGRAEPILLSVLFFLCSPAGADAEFAGGVVVGCPWEIIASDGGRPVFIPSAIAEKRRALFVEYVRRGLIGWDARAVESFWRRLGRGPE